MRPAPTPRGRIVAPAPSWATLPAACCLLPGPCGVSIVQSGMTGSRLSDPLGRMVFVMESPSLQFAAAVRTISAATRAAGLVVPGFRSPPRRPGAERTLRYSADGTATVAVSVRARPFQAVVADLIEGVVIVNHLHGIDATRLRTHLWEVVVSSFADAAWQGAA